MAEKKKKKPGFARKTLMKTVTVKIVHENGLGTYKKGDIVEMSKSTANGVLAQNGIAEKSGKW